MAGKGTPAIVAAERAGISFTVHEYAHDPKAASYGLEAAEKLGVDPARVFKTLVADVDGTLDRRCRARRGAARPEGARQAGDDGGPEARGADDRLRRRRDQPARPAQAAADAASTTRRWPSTTIHVSAGRRGLEIELAPGDLLALTGGEARPLRRQAT